MSRFWDFVVFPVAMAAKFRIFSKPRRSAPSQRRHHVHLIMPDSSKPMSKRISTTQSHVTNFQDEVMMIVSPMKH